MYNTATGEQEKTQGAEKIPLVLDILEFSNKLFFTFARIPLPPSGWKKTRLRIVLGCLQYSNKPKGLNGK